MKLNKFFNIQYTPIVISLLLLLLFLGYYISSTYKLKKKELNKEMTYLFINAFKSSETNVLDKMIFDIKGISLLNNATKSNRLEIVEHRSEIFSFDTTFSDNKRNALAIIVAKNNLDTLFNDSMHVKMEFKADSIGRDTVININERVPFKSNFEEVEKLFIENLKKSGINVKYKISKDTILSLNGIDGYDDPFSKDYYFINADNIFWYLIRKIMPEIVLSLLLLLTVIFAFQKVLAYSKKQKEWYNMKEDFMRNMTHELKTPIATIGVALEAIQNFHAGQDESIKQEYYRIAENENKRLNTLVDKVLSISQNLDHTNEGLEKVHLPTLIAEIVESFRWRADQAGISLQFESIEMNHEVLINSQNILLSLHNLIDNAIKYTVVTYPSIKINLSKSEDKILISVKDNGAPIKEVYKHKIFDKFYRIPKGDVHDVKGHGLGLYIVSHLMMSMRATVNLVTDDTGNKFILSLPYKSSLE